MKTDILNFAKTVENSVNAARPLIKAFVMNESIPWQDRWEVYSTVPDYMFEKSYVYADHNFNGKRICWYDDHNIESGSTVDNVKIIEKYERDYDMPDVIDQLKQDMLKSGVRVWITNW